MLLGFPAAHAAAGVDEEKIWKTLESGGHIVLIRHAVTESGIGDPPEFKLGDCSTQRNLSDKGRSDAKRIGEAFRKRGIPVAEVLSSRWCRCLDTAKLAFGKYTPVPMLDSMFNDRNKPIEEKVREFSRVAAQPLMKGNLVMVTHQYNIDEFTGVSPASGEMVIVRPDRAGKVEVIGRLSVPET
jgi:phosphohistidine phosphatase SixA